MSEDLRAAFDSAAQINFSTKPFNHPYRMVWFGNEQTTLGALMEAIGKEGEFRSFMKKHGEPFPRNRRALDDLARIMGKTIYVWLEDGLTGSHFPGGVVLPAPPYEISYARLAREASKILLTYEWICDHTGGEYASWQQKILFLRGQCSWRHGSRQVFPVKEAEGSSERKFRKERNDLLTKLRAITRMARTGKISREKWNGSIISLCKKFAAGEMR